MISMWLSVIVMLVAFVNGARNEGVVEPCASVQALNSVVPLGSPVTATCEVRDSCLLLGERDVRLEWRLGDRLIPNGLVTNESSGFSQVVIPNFNHTRALLSCQVQGSTPLVVGGVVIRAGYPPEAAQNLSCQTNMTNPNTLTCSWDPGLQETYLPTKYTLHTQIWDSNEKNHSYELPPGVHRYIIPRSDFILFYDMKICVKATNELGEAISAPIVFEPISAAKFEPPTIVKIQTVPKRFGCLQLSWSLSKELTWMKHLHLSLEIRLKTADSGQWPEQPNLLSRVRPSRPVDQCRLLHGTEYQAQIRVRYLQSPWSEWSSSRSGVTLESAPTGRLDWWMKVSGDRKQLNINLFWKRSKQFRANGRNVSYVVSMQKLGSGKVCSTGESYCTFKVPSTAKKVYLSAVNAAGRSNPTEAKIHLPKSKPDVRSVHQQVITDASATPDDDKYLLVQWRSVLCPDLRDFVVEWRPLLNADLSFTHFEIADKNQTSLVIKDHFDTYKPYRISVYPRFKDGPGVPQSVNAYLKQKAPSMVPKIRIKKTSNVDLTWDEIPLEQRNGIIESYKIFYWHEEGPVNVVTADLHERRVVLKDLDTVHLYKAFLMVSTHGGSLNGSTIQFNVETFDAVAIVMIVTASGVGLSLLIIFIVMICFSKQKWLKRHFWPVVPDPANSSMKRWTSESTQDTYLDLDRDEPNPAYLSHLSLLDIPVKSAKEDKDPWLGNAEDTSDLGDSLCGSPFIPGYSGSNSDSVPYATVIFSSPCNSPVAKTSNVYLRSESTQPLLEAEESFTPKCYQNMAKDVMSCEQCFFGPSLKCGPKETDADILWDDFPFLRALAMSEEQDD